MGSAQNKVVALFGGAFNPVHNGHIYIVEKYKEQFPDSLVIWMPSFLSAHKSNIDLTSDLHRVNLVKKILQKRPTLGILSTLEISKKSTSYTIDTVRALKAIYPDTKIHVVIGDDLVNTLSSWKEFDSLAKEVTFVVASRGSSNIEDFDKNIIGSGAFVFLKNSRLEISSTAVRFSLATGNLDSSHLPPYVKKYIYKKGLYRGAAKTHNAIKKAYNFMVKNLSLARLSHCQQVALTAKALAQKYGVSQLLAYQAGFFHDIARELSDKKITCYATKFRHLQKRLWDKEASCKLSYKVGDQNIKPIIFHGEAGGYILWRCGFIDKDFLEAICLHTFFLLGSSALAAIIFLADYLEPTRNFDTSTLWEETKSSTLGEMVQKVSSAMMDYDKKCGRKTFLETKLLAEAKESDIICENRS